jgi:hypothetical protein
MGRTPESVNRAVRSVNVVGRRPICWESRIC